ncbi:MAG: hypothetical protein ACJASW_001173 [Polaribacter sp.]|jgi:hypothetical protein|uniref:hypothetical protein n=1 Tax=Alcanivorax sp. TaxID=1872427 RepID=UPI0039E22638
MKNRILIALIAFMAMSDAWSAESWGPEIIEFQLESTSKIETMIWISGFSYSSSWLLSSLGCADNIPLVGGKELIEVLNYKYRSETITSEQAAAVLSEYLLLTRPCPAYNKTKQ